MKGHQLTAALGHDFAVTGTAGREVFFRDADDGHVYKITGVEREVHHDADGSVTHWIVGERL